MDQESDCPSETETHLGRVSIAKHWPRIMRKHPELAKLFLDPCKMVVLALRNPCLIVRSKRDHLVYIFYRCVTERLCSGFILTAYPYKEASRGQTGLAEARGQGRPRLDVWRLEEGTVSLDLWLGGEELVETRELTENVLAKLDSNGRVVGVEIVELGALTREDLEVLPEEARRLLRRLIHRLADAINNL